MPRLRGLRGPPPARRPKPFEGHLQQAGGVRVARAQPRLRRRRRAVVDEEGAEARLGEQLADEPKGLAEERGVDGAAQAEPKPEEAPPPPVGLAEATRRRLAPRQLAEQSERLLGERERGGLAPGRRGLPRATWRRLGPCRLRRGERRAPPGKGAEAATRVAAGVGADLLHHLLARGGVALGAQRFVKLLEAGVQRDDDRAEEGARELGVVEVRQEDAQGGEALEADGRVCRGVEPRARDERPLARDAHLPPPLDALEQPLDHLLRRQEVDDLVRRPDGRRRVRALVVGEEARPAHLEAAGAEGVEEGAVLWREGLGDLRVGRRRRPRLRAARLEHPLQQRAHQRAQRVELLDAQRRVGLRSEEGEDHREQHRQRLDERPPAARVAEALA